jgi:Zn-finger nucleic acid-binding protein
MKCPVCSVDLTMSERQGVEIDYCPKCRGVWLDRGELDKIIDRSHTDDVPTQQPAVQQRPVQPVPVPVYQQQYDQGYYKHKKRKNFLDDIFDF